MRSSTTALLALAALLVIGCSGDPVVARLESDTVAVDLPHGSSVALTLRWALLGQLPPEAGAPTVFVHLLDPAGDVVRTSDHPLPGVWREGFEVVDRLRIYHSLVSPALPPGRYRLTAGLYDGTTRWALRTSGREVHPQEYEVARVVVPEEADLPRCQFEGEWNPVEPGGDRQVPARRWLAGRGTIVVTGLREARTLWLVLWLPEADARHRLVVEPETGEAQLRVASDCAGEASVSGAGRHELGLDLTPVEGGDECRVELHANFELVDVDTLAPQVVSVDQLAWGEIP